MKLHTKALILTQDALVSLHSRTKRAMLAGKEESPCLGIAYMVEEHWDKIDSEFALAEGGSSVIRDGKVRCVGIASTEKVGRGLRLVAHGNDEHISIDGSGKSVGFIYRTVLEVAAAR